jgi:hypothetical protein
MKIINQKLQTAIGYIGARIITPGIWSPGVLANANQPSTIPTVIVTPISVRFHHRLRSLSATVRRLLSLL